MSSGTGILINGTTMLVTKGSFELIENPSTFTVGNSVDPNASERVLRNTVVLNFTPDGRITNAALALMLSNSQLVPGTNLFSDAQWILIGTNGEKWVFKNMAITKLPNLKLATSGSLAGQMTLTGIPLSTAAPSDADAIYSYTTGAAFPGYYDTVTIDGDTITGAAAYNIQHALTQHYTLNWKDSSNTDITGFASFYGREGIDVSLNMSAAEVPDDKNGLSGMLFAGLKASFSLMPVGPTQAQIDTALRIQNTGAGPGTSITQDGYKLKASAPLLLITLNNAGLKSNSRVFDPTKPRQGRQEWVGSSSYVGATWTPAISYVYDD